MRQKYKVFIQDTPVYFVEGTLKKGIKKEGGVVLEVNKQKHIDKLYPKVKENPDASAFYVHSERIEEAWHWFVDLHKLIAAAGGLVHNDDDEILCIYRKKRWDLPKGKIDPGETIREAAIREVQEECGIEELEITKKLCKTFHTYKNKGTRILKPTYWFAMSYHGTDTPTPQLEEGITEIRWIHVDALDVIIRNTYPSLHEVLFKAESSLQD